MMWRRRSLQRTLARNRAYVAALRACTHPDAVPVRSIVDGSVVAYLCPDCGKQLIG